MNKFFASRCINSRHRHSCLCVFAGSENVETAATGFLPMTRVCTFTAERTPAAPCAQPGVAVAQKTSGGVFMRSRTFIVVLMLAFIAPVWAVMGFASPEGDDAFLGRWDITATGSQSARQRFCWLEFDAGRWSAQRPLQSWRWRGVRSAAGCDQKWRAKFRLPRWKTAGTDPAGLESHAQKRRACKGRQSSMARPIRGAG